MNNEVQQQQPPHSMSSAESSSDDRVSGDWKQVELTLLGYGLPASVVYSLSRDYNAIQDLLLYARQCSAREEKLEGIVIETKRQRDELADALKVSEEKRLQYEAFTLSEFNRQSDCEQSIELQNRNKNLEEEIADLRDEKRQFEESLAGKVTELAEERAKNKEKQNRLRVLGGDSTAQSTSLLSSPEIMLAKKETTISQQKKEIHNLKMKLLEAEEVHRQELKNFSGWKNNKYQPLKDKLQQMSEKLSAVTEERDQLFQQNIPKLCADVETQTGDLPVGLIQPKPILNDGLPNKSAVSKRKRTIQFDKASSSVGANESVLVGEGSAEKIAKLKAKLSAVLEKKQKLQESNKRWFKWKMECHEPMKLELQKAKQKLVDTESECKRVDLEHQVLLQMPGESNQDTGVLKSPLLDKRETEQLRNQICSLVSMIGKLTSEKDQLQNRINILTEDIERRNQRLHAMNQMFKSRLDDYERYLREHSRTLVEPVADSRNERNFLRDVIRSFDDARREIVGTISSDNGSKQNELVASPSSLLTDPDTGVPSSTT